MYGRVINSGEIMDASFYLVKVFGAYFILIALLFTLFPKRTKEAVASIFKEMALIRILGLFHLFASAPILLAYYGQTEVSAIIMQVIGALLLFSGVTRFVFTAEVKEMTARLAVKKYEIFYLIALWLFGLYLFAVCC
jgi:hypothetical protein